MLQVLKSAYRFLGKKTYVLHLGSTTFKVFSPRKITYRHAELYGNAGALKQGFWLGHVLEVKPCFLSLQMQKGRPVAQAEAALVNAFLDRKLRQALTYPRKLAANAFNFDALRSIEPYGLVPELLNQARHMLEHFSLPETSAHGDFHPGNMICIGTEIKLIDWSMFAERGSFITDFIHFHTYRTARCSGESWSKAILRDSDPLDELSALCGVPANSLRTVYSLCRMAGELHQRRSAADLHESQIKKYNFVLDKLVNNA